MNTTLIKFLTYLKEEREKEITSFKERVDFIEETREIEEELKKIDEKIIIVENIIKLFSIKKENWEKHRILCKDFDILSDLLLKSPLNTKERTEIIFLLAEKNIKGKILDNTSVIIDFPSIQNHKFKTLNEEDLEDEYLIYQLLTNKEETSISWSQEQKDEFIDFANQHIIDISDVQKYHSYIQEHYFEKKNTYRDFDIIIVLRSLKELGVNEEIIKTVKYVLEKDLNSRKKKQQLKEVKIKPILPPSNYRTKMIKQLESAIDLRDMLPKDNITYRQMIEYVSLMIELGYPQDNIYEFLRNIEIKRNCSKMHPITKYIEEYERLKYYEDKLVLFDELKTIEEYFQMLWISNDEDYCFWKNCFQEELTNYLRTIPGGYEYELKTAIKKKEKRKLEINNN